jgi:hypothetical protein
MLKDFLRLPLEIQKPKSPGEYRLRNFLFNFGSHYISYVKTGAKINYWTKNISKKKYSELDINTEACAKFPPTDGVTIDLCQKNGIDNKKENLNKTFTDEWILLGGDQDIADTIRNKKDVIKRNGTIESFLKTANKDTVIKAKFDPIWNLLSRLGETDEIRTQNEQRAIVMADFYNHALISVLSFHSCDDRRRNPNGGKITKDCRCGRLKICRKGDYCEPESQGGDGLCYGHCRETSILEHCKNNEKEKQKFQGVVFTTLECCQPL